jgi:hypothetical protein
MEGTVERPKDSWAQVIYTGLYSQNLAFGAPPFPYQPWAPASTSPTLQYQYLIPSPFGRTGSWTYPVGNPPVMTFENIVLAFTNDPAYPQFNPSLVTLYLTVATGSFNGHYWQTPDPQLTWEETRPHVRVNVIGKSSYPLVPVMDLGFIATSPYTQNLQFSKPFDASLWDCIDYCTIDVGGWPASYSMNLG